MSNKNDGGQVYPQVPAFWDAGSQCMTEPTPGITRRDWLAGLAMQSVVGLAGARTTQEAVRWAYALADAMIAEGERDG
jgi:hypothetical protein